MYRTVSNFARAPVTKLLEIWTSKFDFILQRVAKRNEKRACLVRATVEHELIVSYLELKNAIFLVLTLIKHSLGMSEQLSL